MAYSANLEASGLKRFGQSWRGLEAPRHLVMYSMPSMIKMLEGVGFERVTLLPWKGGAQFYFDQSYAMESGVDPYGASIQVPEEVRAAAAKADTNAFNDPTAGESFTVVAYRPTC
jgi:hypothetical protein